MANYHKHYDWDEVQRFYDEGHSFRDCYKRFGMAARSLSKAQQRGDFVSRGIPDLLPLKDLKSRSTVRSRIIKYKLLPYECSICGLDRWLGQELSLSLDHINGINDDHRLENLRWVCPNCDNQLPTFAGRNTNHSKIG